MTGLHNLQKMTLYRRINITPITNQSEHSQPSGSHEICLRQHGTRHQHRAWNMRSSQERREAQQHGRGRHSRTLQLGQYRLNHTNEQLVISTTC